MKGLGILTVLITGALLVYAARDFPVWGDPGSPASANRISQHYITQSYSETTVPNMVTAVLADYRGYDTLFETVVIFTAGIAILGVLRVFGRGGSSRMNGGRERTAATPDLIIVTTCRLLIPIIQLFAFYVVAHGHYSPGGGFQGGVILGASFILYAIGHDLSEALRMFPERRAVLLANSGVLLYAGIGSLCLLFGANFLDYGALSGILPGSQAEARSLSILGVEIGVALTVSAVMFTIYCNLSSKGRLQGGL